MKIQNWEQFNESNDFSLNEELSNLQKEYRKYFKFMLKCYEVESPSKLSDEKKKEFFDNIKKYWVKGQGATKDLEEIEKEICDLSEKKVGDDAIGLDIKNDISKLIDGGKGGSIDLGKVGQVADATITNIKQTYKDAIVKVIDDRYVLMIK